ncbi:hypothetical protein MNB_SM-4-1692 [hydrothermal vent metagenome]|uniref:Uncharacterized protein n=1 Tax=hydrothermal vent metagenome TaxID=652676 RepID=A0A1W1CS91_9ZZZZ
MNKQEFIAALQTKFPSNEIVTLKELTKSITGTSKVRVGNIRNRQCSEYFEVSFKHINKLNHFFIPTDHKKLEAANETSLGHQALCYHNLLLPRRYTIGKIGLVTNELLRANRYTVGNNNMIKIDFKYNVIEDTPVYVLEYLKLEFVKEYIKSQIEILDAKHNPKTKNLLRTSILEELPIPSFKEQDGYYKKSIESKLYKLELLSSIKKKMEFILTQADKRIFKKGLNSHEEIHFTPETLECIEMLDGLKKLDDKISECFKDAIDMKS